MNPEYHWRLRVRGADIVPISIALRRQFFAYLVPKYIFELTDSGDRLYRSHIAVTANKPATAEMLLINSWPFRSSLMAMQFSKLYKNGGLKPEIWMAIGLSALVFLLNRHIVRPWVLQNIDGGVVVVLVNSLPNLVEAITGTITIAGILLAIRGSVAGRGFLSDDTTVYAVATVIAGLFVFSSELNWIRLRGPNVYDPYDVIASLIGLFLIYVLLTRIGLFDEAGAEDT